MTEKTLIVIPARYGSTRFPGKPLHLIAGKSLLARVCEIARTVCERVENTDWVVATDDRRIQAHALDLHAPVVMTPEHCACGTERALAAIETLEKAYDSVINLQGDVPVLPLSFVIQVIAALNDSETQIATPVVQLSWSALDLLREQKKTTPFSGTTAILNDRNQAIWFSKNIIPAIRNEGALRKTSPLSPVYKHVGLYGYKLKTLQLFSQLSESYYEQLEGLEQLRAIESGISIQAVKVHYGNTLSSTGIDTLEDAARLEKLILEYGEPVL